MPFIFLSSFKLSSPLHKTSEPCQSVSSLCIQHCCDWSQHKQQRPRQSWSACPTVQPCPLEKPALLSGVQDMALNLREPTLHTKQPAEEQVPPSFAEHLLCLLVQEERQHCCCCWAPGTAWELQPQCPAESHKCQRKMMKYEFKG